MQHEISLREPLLHKTVKDKCIWSRSLAQSRLPCRMHLKALLCIRQSAFKESETYSVLEMDRSQHMCWQLLKLELQKDRNIHPAVIAGAKHRTFASQKAAPGFPMVIGEFNKTLT